MAINKKEIARLKNEKRLWIEETFNANDVAKQLKIGANELAKVKTTKKFGMERYSSENIQEYLDQKETETPKPI